MYETDSAVDITECVKGISKDRGDVTGAGISWEAPDEGEWSIFYLYRQGMGDAEKPTLWWTTLAPRPLRRYWIIGTTH